MWIHSWYAVDLPRTSCVLSRGRWVERLHVLDLHRGFVKGVCWDPVGEFLATASDDRSVKIWRTSDWSLEAEVEKPFEASPGTFFRRLRYAAALFWVKLLTVRSWSPDGAHITASNATNNQGFVFIAAVIARNSWTSEISLVGHENTVEVSVRGSSPTSLQPALNFPVLQPPYLRAQHLATRCHIKYLFCCGPWWR